MALKNRRAKPPTSAAVEERMVKLLGLLRRKSLAATELILDEVDRAAIMSAEESGLVSYSMDAKLWSLTEDGRALIRGVTIPEDEMRGVKYHCGPRRARELPGEALPGLFL